MHMTSALDPLQQTTAGGCVDTHSQVNHAAVLEETGLLLPPAEFATTLADRRELVDWLMDHDVVSSVGIGCSGGYGTRLVRILTEAAITVFEVHQPHRYIRVRLGKGGRIDAVAAERKVLAGCHRPPEGHHRADGTDARFGDTLT
ncbi:hypothetical protein CRM73_01980 [Kocuria sp. CCUG 69068]|nr:hypothetical protein [Kocuria sp. CCUG 69068]